MFSLSKESIQFERFLLFQVLRGKKSVEALCIVSNFELHVATQIGEPRENNYSKDNNSK